VEEYSTIATEAIVEAVEDLPEECLSDLAYYAETLRRRAALQAVPMASASEATLAKDWLEPEEDDRANQLLNLGKA